MAISQRDTSRTFRVDVCVDGRNIILPPGHLLLRPTDEVAQVGGIVVAGQRATRRGTLLAQGPPTAHTCEYPIGSEIHHVKTNSLEIEMDGRKYFIVHSMDVRLAVVP